MTRVNPARLPADVRASIEAQAPGPIGGDVERIRSALAAVPPDDREIWLKLGMAIKSELGAGGFESWNDWSQGSDAYKAADARDVWRSIKPNGGITIASLFHEAKSHGWRDAEPPIQPTPEEVAERQRRADEQSRKDAADLAREQDETAEKALSIWTVAKDEASGHPYLVRKGVTPTDKLRQIDVSEAKKLIGYHPQVGGEKLSGPLLVAPIERDGRMASLEVIDGDGRKAALRGRGTKAGGYWCAQSLPDEGAEGFTLLIGEGVATVLSAMGATGHSVVAALALSNFAKVLKTMRARYPKAQMVLLADLDKHTGQPDPKVIDAARSVGASIAAPDFGPDRPEGATDFNDLHQTSGLDAVREQIEAAIVPTEDQGEPDMPEFDYEPGYFQGDADAERDPAIEDVAAVPSKKAPDGWKLTRNMVFEIKEKKDDTDYVPVCGPLWVIGRTNGAHGEWGLVLAFRDHDGREHRQAIPAERLHEDAGILSKELARQGLLIVTGKEKRLLAYVCGWKTDVRILSAKRLGWLEDPTGALSFVMPDRVITRDGNQEVVFQPERYSPTVRTVHGAGTLADWQSRVAGPVCQHPPMRFALCAGLAPAFLSFAEAGDSFILHFWGKTSRGKTTVGQIAASPWGCAADPNDAPSLTFVRRWNVTGNGLEGLAEAHSDMPLVLDELGSSTIGDIRPLVYQLAGGQGKTALNSAREMKEPRSWRTIAISTGELSLHARMADPDGDGTKTRTVKGGLTHRALDIEVADIAGASPAPEREGIVSGIKVACARCYGTAGPELVRIIAERFETAAHVRAYVREQVAEITADIAPAGLPAETARGVRRFALIAMAGEFAAHAGLIPTDAEMIREATREIVTAWLGSSAETDEERIVASVRAFILKHESRFQRTSDDEVVPNRAGFVDRVTGRWCFTDAGLIEASPGNDKATIARTLRKNGFLFTNEKEKLMARVSVGDGRPWLYVVKGSILDGAPDEKSEQSSQSPGQPGQPGHDQQPQGIKPVPAATGTPGQPGQPATPATTRPCPGCPACPGKKQ